MEGSLRALKILVAVMGVMLVLGVAALAVGVAYKLGHRRPHASRPAAASLAAPTLTAGNRRPAIIALPPGARIIGSQTDGDRLLVRLALPDGGEEFALFDWKTGARIGAFDFRPGAPAH
jgi:hypothetical protein